MASDYHVLADEIANDIAKGKLAPGQKMLPQREYAYRRGIAASTAGRVYKELVSRGLIAGEVGRGTYVRYAPAEGKAPLAEPPDAPVNLELNVPGTIEGPERLGAAFYDLLRNPELFAESMRPIPSDGWREARRAVADHLSVRGWTPDADRILFTGNGKQALSAMMSAFAGPGERLAIEALTYPLAKTIAEKQKTNLMPLRMDDNGVLPSEIDRIAKAGGVKAVYLQPSLHNPTGAAMPLQRRAEIADRLRTHGMIAIEDRVYVFLSRDPAPPLAALAPENVVVVDSFSKRLCAGLSIGVVVAPPALVDRCRASINAIGLTPQRIPLEIAVRWILSGIASKVEQDKQKDAAARNRLARRYLKGQGFTTDRNSYHIWLNLPEAWRTDRFVAEARERGIAISPASAFCIQEASAPNAVRIALASPPADDLDKALKVLVQLLNSSGETG